MRKARLASVIGLLSIFSSVCVQAQQQAATAPPVPTLVNFTGKLTDLNGKPLTGIVGVTFCLYKDSEGGAPLWMEIQNVEPDKNGRYTVMLGTTTSSGLPTDLFASGEARWLGVQVAGQAEQPRVMLLSVPYALKAGDAATVGGLPPSAFVLSAPPGAVTKSETASSSNSTSLSLTGSGTIDFLPLWTSSTNLGSSIMFEDTTHARIGINTKTPGATLDVKGGTTFEGFLNLPATGAATSSGGRNSQPQDFVASSFNSGTKTAVSQTFQWQAEPTGNNTSSPSGKLNLLFGSGTGAPAETGLSISNKGIIAFAAGQTLPTVSGNETVNGNFTATGSVSGASANFSGAVSTGGQTVTGNITDLGNISASGSISAATGTFTGNNTAEIVGVTQSGAGAALAVSSQGPGVVAKGRSAGVEGFGIASGAVGVFGSGNGSGAGVTGSGGTANGTGVIGNGSGTAATGVLGFGAGSGTGVVGQGGSNGNGVAGEGNGSGTGVLGIGGAGNGVGVVGNGSGPNAIGVVGNGAGNGAGVAGNGSGIGAGVVGTGGLSNGAGVAGQGTGTRGVGVLGTEPTLSKTGASLLGNVVTGVWGDVNQGSQTGEGMIATADDTVALLGQNNSTLQTAWFKNASGAAAALTFKAEGTAAGGSCTIDVFGNVNCNGNATFSTGGLFGSLSSGCIFSGGGTLECSGAITSNGAKPFKIDDPADPADKYLIHVAVESSEMINIYTGNVVLDSRGAATVQLSSWFQAENADCRYALTAIGTPAPNLYIAQEVTNNQFEIAGGSPGQKVSWQITAPRQDAWAKANPLIPEQDKPADERGLYIHPELYSQPKEKGIGSARAAELLKRLGEKRQAPIAPSHVAPN